jgi:DNA-directed RNA polymerase specialized sigma24 family protein
VHGRRQLAGAFPRAGGVRPVGTTLALESNVRADKVDSGNDEAEWRCWLDRFHAGESQALEEIYHQHFDTIDREVGCVLSGADRETLVYEVFRRLLQEEPFRRGFRAGDLREWLRATARDLATEYARRGNRAAPVGADDAGLTDEARRLMERFLSDVLPPSWHALFQMRFVARLSRTEAAAALGHCGTTLALRELRIRQLLRKFLLAA